jgi:anti-sigma factor ChrR (cupin superfamily)
MRTSPPRALTHERCRELRSRILRRLAERQSATATIRAAEGEWLPLAPGVCIKLLRRDESAGTMTAFVRMEPGSALASHAHTQAEECLMLEGEILIGAHRVAAGDLHVASAVTPHEVITSPHGALMLIRAEYRAQP